MLRNRKGFTLIELMIVVAIIGILAAIAIPNFISMQLRAKRAELPTNLDGIRTAEKAYHAEWDQFTNAGPSPATTPGRPQVEFTPTAAWSNLGWTADGKVRGKYQVTAVPGASSQTDNFNGSAVADVDGDSTESSYTCNRAIKAKMRSANNVY
ncbi:MAG: dolichyl-phosphate-mannose--protein mannosyltransferase [Rickettsiales bacterium]|nr:dolichyl-phosphate-mannose--protein mannosyltransferase [Rickettsiales bacterium]|tara:strand:+ start:589 stop:1047 length:459 start_codon:yes stop_codon:yes gene_type:complete